MQDVARLLQRLRKVEALWKGATTPGEARAAAEARQRLLRRLEQLGREQPPPPPPPEPEDEPLIEYRFTLRDPWARALFQAILRRHGLDYYRYPRQKRTTMMVEAPRRLIDEEVWPEYRARWSALEKHIARATRHAVEEVHRAR